MSASPWRKSSRSQSQGQCVEVRLNGDVEMRDSKAPAAGSLAVARNEFAILLDSVR